MTQAVYIHTRDRLTFLEQTLPKWPEVTPESTLINLVVEPNEVRKHQRFLSKLGLEDRIGVIAIDGKNLGMGNSRNVAFHDALAKGHESFITTDDDLFPKDDPTILLDTATMDTVLGVGCYFSMYGLLLKIKPNTGLYKIGVGLGFRCFAMNTALLDEVGGFPVEFKGYDDHEIARIGISKLGIPWRMDSDMSCHSVAKIGDPGGMTSLPGYARVVDRKHTAHVLTHKNWPGFVSDPAKCDPDSGRCTYTMQWKKFLKAHDVSLEG
jgi:hypothetical protein